VIEQFAKDVVTIEQTKAAESSKLLMQIMALMRRRLKENNIGIDLKEGSNVRIDVDGKTVFRGKESDRRVDAKVEPEVLQNIAGLLNSPRGTAIDSPYQNISIKIDGREIFKVENGLVVMNEMAPAEKERESDPKATDSRPPLNRSEQLSRMKSDLKGLQLIESLETLLKEKGKSEGTRKVLEHGKYRFSLEKDKLTVRDTAEKRDLFEREAGKIKRTSLTEEDIQEIGGFIERENREKEKTGEKEEDYPPLAEREDTEIER
jgi:hypothetical protein